MSSPMKIAQNTMNTVVGIRCWNISRFDWLATYE